EGRRVAARSRASGDARKDPRPAGLASPAARAARHHRPAGARLAGITPQPAADRDDEAEGFAAGKLPRRAHLYFLQRLFTEHVRAVRRRHQGRQGVALPRAADAPLPAPFDAARARGTAHFLEPADEVLLAERHAVVAQDVVRRGDVEVEVRVRVAEQVVEALEAQLPRAHLEHHLARLGAVDPVRLDRLDELERPGDARLQIGERLLGV